MPIRLRLTLWYGALTGVVVVLVCMIVYAVHTRAHYDDVDRMLTGVAEHTAGRYAENPTQEQLDAMLSVPVGPSMAVRAYGPDQEMLAEGPNARGRAPEVDPRGVLAHPSGPAFDPIARLGPQLEKIEAGRGAFGLTSDPDGDRWRLYVLPVDNGPTRYFVFAAPIADVDATVTQLRWLVALLTLGAVVTTMVASTLLAGRALRPAADLDEIADSIARSRDFSQRVNVGKDRDELGRLATTFNGMLDSLEGAYQAQKRFVADASHEMRAPLTAIQGNLELLQRHPDKPPAEQHEAVSEANREARRLSHLVADLLALARADAGVSLRRDRVELDRVVLEALSIARHMARGQQVELAALEPALVEGDADRLKEFFLILFDNAIKYTPPDGQIIVNLCRNGASAEVTVRDTGVGIAPEDLPRVFDRFYRADPARARDPGGTGLGLSIARWISEAHGGRIQLDSKPGEGTTVTVRLPFYP